MFEKATDETIAYCLKVITWILKVASYLHDSDVPGVSKKVYTF